MRQAQSENDDLSLQVEGYGSDGAGIAHLEDGCVIFVRGALAGERCRVRLLKRGKHAAWGETVEVLSPSPARRTSDCPHYPDCGGCQLRHMSYEEELHFKRERVQEALHRIGGTELVLSAIHGAQEQERYRNKLQFPLSPGGAEGVKIGFYRGRSHEVVDVSDCLLQPEAGSRLRGALKTWMLRYGVSAYNERTHEGLLRHFYVRTNREGDALCVLVVNGKRLPQEEDLIQMLRAVEPCLRGVLLSINREKTNVILGKSLRTLWGEDYLEDTLCGLRFRLSPHSFYQVNREQTEVLYHRVLELAALQGTDLVLDLYCGIGTITLALAQQAGRVIGVEVVEAAVHDARANAARNGIENVEFLCADAGEAAALLQARGEKPDLICVDPPRKGLSLPLIDTIAAIGPARLLYVSCDPATLARDLKLLHERGYHPLYAESFDLFPRTMHVETCVLLSHTSPPS